MLLNSTWQDPKFPADHRLQQNFEAVRICQLFEAANMTTAVGAFAP
jgi:hypothetical protein